MYIVTFLRDDKPVFVDGVNELVKLIVGASVSTIYETKVAKSFDGSLTDKTTLCAIFDRKD